MNSGHPVRPLPHPHQLELHCQRWNQRRASYRPAGEIFDPRGASVELGAVKNAESYATEKSFTNSTQRQSFKATPSELFLIRVKLG
jgi:hypothetical protein